MAEMRPRYYNKKFTESRAERKLFEKLKSSCPSDWIVFHSLDVPYSSENLPSDIDFLVLVPDLGVAAFEVKGGNIRIDNNIWYSNDKDINDPFKQIKNNIYKIRDEYEKQCGEDSFPHFDYGVMFPDCPFPLESINIEQWRIFYKHNMHDVTSFIRSFLNTSLQKWEEVYKKKRSKRKLPTKDVLNDIAEKFIPKTNKEVITYADWKKIIEYSQTLFKEEQLQALCNTTYAHNRCLIEGYTGTGKTIIAIETAKFSLKKMEENVAFFCYNSILANWLKKELSSVLNEHSFVGVFHDFLIEKIDITLSQDEMPNNIRKYINKSKNISQDKIVTIPDDFIDNDDFWENTVPETALIAFKKNPVKYDKIIIDEAQDILVENYIYVLNEILKGGITKGKWCFFADSEQNIEKSKNNKILYDDVIGLLGTPWDDFSRPPPLTENWRNTKNINKDILRFTNWSNYHITSVKDGEGQDVKYYKWSTRVEQKENIEKCLTNLIEKENIGRNDITLLSTYDPHRYKNPTWYEKSVLSEITEHKLIKYKEGVKDKENEITYSSIASFKGRENSTIILVDVESYENRNLLYVGMSRATIRLIVFESEQAEKERKKL